MKLDLSLSGEIPDQRMFDEINSVGLLRGEYIFRRASQYITSIHGIDLMKNYIENIINIFPNKDVWYRFIDAPSNEINMLQGYDRYVLEEFPTLGLRGMRRAVEFSDTFNIEFNVIAELAAKHPNLNIIFPYICELSEIEYGLGIAKTSGFKNKICCMMETPAAFWHAKDIQRLGISHFLIGMNDMSSLVAGASRGSGFDNHEHPALLGMIKNLRHELNHSTISIAGYMKPHFYDIAKNLGMDALSLHYSSFPDFFGDKFNDYHDIDFMTEFKKTDNKKRLKLWAQSLLDIADDSQMTTQGLNWSKSN